MARVKFTTTIDEEILQWVKIQAIKEKRSVSNLIEEMVKQKQKQAKTKSDISSPD